MKNIAHRLLPRDATAIGVKRSLERAQAELEGTMAATAGSTTSRNETIDRQIPVGWHEWTPTALTASVIVAVAVVSGVLWIGAVVAGLFVAGNAIVAVEGRSLRNDEFIALSVLHVLATLVLTLSF